MLLTITHRTTYRYASPVELGTHRLMVRPRDSFDLRLISADLTLSPPGRTAWFHDSLGNAVATVQFAGVTDLLEIVSCLKIERFASTAPSVSEPAETRFPIVYRTEEVPELTPFITPVTEDPNLEVKRFMAGPLDEAAGDGLVFLDRLNGAIRGGLRYARRDEEGTQAPVATLTSGAGSCRDYAWLFVEVARRAGFAARFVSGYLYDAGAEAQGLVGGGATHAWAEVYIPGTGWVEYDPTNGLIAEQSLLRVAVARTPEQAAPISGSYTGPAGACIALEVDVSVTSDVPSPAPSMVDAA